MGLTSAEVNKLIHEYFQNEGLTLCAKAIEVETGIPETKSQGGDSKLVNLLLKGIETEKLENEVSLDVLPPNISLFKLRPEFNNICQSRFVVKTPNYYVFTLDNKISCFDLELNLVFQTEVAVKTFTCLKSSSLSDTVLFGCNTGKVFACSIGPEFSLGNPVIISLGYQVKQLEISVCGVYGACITDKGECKVFEIRLGEVLTVLPYEMILSIAFLNEQTLALGVENTIVIYNFVEGVEKQKLEGHSAPIMCLYCDVSSQLLFSGSLNGEINVWNANLSENQRDRVKLGPDAVTQLIACGENLLVVTLVGVFLVNKSTLQTIRHISCDSVMFAAAQRFLVVCGNTGFSIYTLDLQLIAQSEESILDAVWDNSRLVTAGGGSVYILESN